MPILCRCHLLTAWEVVLVVLELLGLLPSAGLLCSSGPDILFLCGSAVMTGICSGRHLSPPVSSKLPVECMAFPHLSPYLIALGGTWESPVLEGHGAEVLLGFSCLSINSLAKVESWVWD